MQRDHIRRLTIGAALVALLLLPGPVTSAPPALSPVSSATRTPDNRLDVAAAAMGEHRYEAAIIVLTEIIDGGTLPKQQLALAYHHRGIAHQKSGASGAAVLDYTRAIELGSLPREMTARLYYNRALAVAAAGDAAGAERDYSSAIELSPDYAPAWHNRANLERERQDYPTAIRDYGEAIARIDGEKRKLPLFGRALAYEKSGDLPATAADLREALAADPQFEMARAKLGELEPQLALMNADDGLKTGSVAPAERTIEIAPRNGWNTTAVRYETDRSEPARAPTPEPERQQASTTPTEPVAPSSPAAAGRYRIQLGAFRAADDAAKAWKDLRRRHQTLAALGHRIEEANLGARGTYYRLQAGAFETRSEARSLCAKLKADRLDCMVAGG